MLMFTMIMLVYLFYILILWIMYGFYGAFLSFFAGNTRYFWNGKAHYPCVSLHGCYSLFLWYAIYVLYGLLILEKETKGKPCCSSKRKHYYVNLWNT
jgi:hypothetical protein